ncbi:MAG: hypothetical protein AB7N80_10555 [Bdellovibrionales bacterium]
MRAVALGLLLTLAISAEAKLFTNSYVSFELPPNWDCSREGTEWLCVSQFEKSQQKEAIIVLTAKEVGPADTLQQYMAHLKEPRLLPNKSGPPIASKVLHVQQRTLNNHPWVDGLHQGSEVSTYYTRYLGTVKDRVAILVTFSAHRSSYTKYSNDFIRAIDSLRVTATKDLIGKNPVAGKGSRSETFGQPIPPGGMMGTEGLPGEDGSGGKDNLRKLLGLALIAAAIGIFILMRTRKNKQRKR